MNSSQCKKYVWVFLGMVFIGHGLLGVLVPLLPTTPFILLAALCFAKGSPRLYCWLSTHKTLGPYLMRYEKRIPFSTRQKIFLLVWLWGGLVFSFLCMRRIHAVPFLLLVGILVSLHVFKDPT